MKRQILSLLLVGVLLGPSAALAQMGYPPAGMETVPAGPAFSPGPSSPVPQPPDQSGWPPPRTMQPAAVFGARSGGAPSAAARSAGLSGGFVAAPGEPCAASAVILTTAADILAAAIGILAAARVILTAAIIILTAAAGSRPDLSAGLVVRAAGRSGNQFDGGPMRTALGHQSRRPLAQPERRPGRPFGLYRLQSQRQRAPDGQHLRLVERRRPVPAGAGPADATHRASDRHDVDRDDGLGPATVVGRPDDLRRPDQLHRAGLFALASASGRS